MTRTISPGSLSVVTSDGNRHPPSTKTRHPAIRLHSLDEIRREMADCYRQAKRGAIPISDAARMVFILSEMVKLWHVKMIEDRINKLEEKL